MQARDLCYLASCQRRGVRQLMTFDESRKAVSDGYVVVEVNILQAPPVLLLRPERRPYNIPCAQNLDMGAGEIECSRDARAGGTP